MTEFVVQTSEFTGPLDLLLHLIEKRKLFIGDISLGEVSEDFIDYVNKLESFPIDSVANFIVIAATLLLIKSRSLLPGITLTDEESYDISELERRLKLYRQFRNLSKHIRQAFGVHILFAKNHYAPIDPVFSPHASITKEKMLLAAKSVISSFPEAEKIPKTVVSKVMSLEDMIDNLTKRVRKGINLSFTDISSTNHKNSKEKKLHIILSFLAVLELVKSGVVAVTQSECFQDIKVAES